MRGELRLSYWNENYTSRDVLIDRLAKSFGRSGFATVPDSGWRDFDLEVRTSALSRVELKTADEEHGGLKVRNLVVIRPRMSRFMRAGLFVAASAAAIFAMIDLTGIALACAFLASALTIFAASDLLEAGQIAYRAVEQTAAELQLIPLGATSRTHLGETAGAGKPASAIEFVQTPPPVD